jgi:hypothetical protein
MNSVTGIGGIFFKSENPERLYQRYEKHLGIRRERMGKARHSNGGNRRQPMAASLV